MEEKRRSDLGAWEKRAIAGVVSIIGLALAGVLQTAIQKFGDLPTRVSVLEAQFSNVDSKLDKLGDKMDRLLQQ